MQGSSAELSPPHDIHGLLPYVESSLWLIALAAAGLVVAVALLYWWQRRRQTAEPAAEVRREVDPYASLAEQVQSLALPEPFTGKARSDFYFALSHHLRACVELRTRINCTDLTYDELVSPLQRQLPLMQDKKDDLLALLRESDLVKYADFDASASDGHKAKERVIELMKLLRPAAVGPYPSDLAERADGRKMAEGLG